MENNEKVKIGKNPMERFPSFKKQAFLMILSFLEFEELFVVGRVCKTFFFMLKEDEKLWKSFADKNIGVKTLPEGMNSWKEFCLVSRLEWDDSKLEGTELETDETKKILNKKTGAIWTAAISSSHLLEGLMYGFEILEAKA